MLDISSQVPCSVRSTSSRSRAKSSGSGSIAISAFNAHEFLVDSTFWSKLDALRALLKPIDDTIKASESNKSDLAKVLPRWAEIFAHFQRQNPLLQSALDDFLSPQGEKHTFQSRYRRQVKPIHIVAHFLP